MIMVFWLSQPKHQISGSAVCETVVLTAAVNDTMGIQNPNGFAESVGSFSNSQLLIQKIS
jgi:hypothetical protein